MAKKPDKSDGTPLIIVEESEANGPAAAVRPKYRQLTLQRPQSSRRSNTPICQACRLNSTKYKETPTSCLKNTEHYAIIIKNYRSLKSFTLTK